MGHLNTDRGKNSKTVSNSFMLLKVHVVVANNLVDLVPLLQIHHNELDDNPQYSKKILGDFLSLGKDINSPDDVCCYTEYEALKYQGLTSDENASDKFADTQRLHVRFRRNTNGNESSCSNHDNCTERINHKYYVSEVVGRGQRYWMDIKGHPNTTAHPRLSNQFLRTRQLRLSFKFPYYGHYLDRVLLTTGGNVPVAVDSIPDHRHHPVRVGISDAFVMWHRNPVSLVLSRIFYVYSQVNISKKSVVNGSAVIFHPLRKFIQAIVYGIFPCFHCRCSDGADRHRAEWESNGCGSVAVKKDTSWRCVDVSTKFPTTFPTASPERRKTSTAVKGLVAAAKQHQSRNVTSAGAIVGICIALVLVISVGAWCLYAYRNPASKAGLCVTDK
ncbi:Plexin domain-containing protein 2 [Acropora cervicornis]|uniref:Plexin domain-containing protein 2 n=1 Tax=Acropora cervicornis TaxID=6130 RepID=A0AAD9QNZ6_ACRCE|nr:Plexin domain-containing protein 2 [Acropora cervicornis]